MAGNGRIFGGGGSNQGAGYQVPQQQLPQQWVTRTPLYIIQQQPQLPDVLTSAYTLDLTTIGALPEGTLMQTRASSATFFDSTGILKTAGINEERFDYKWNGSSWVAGGMLSEEQRTNNCAPRDISSWSVWGGAGNTTAPTATGIDGVSTSGHTMVPSTSGASAHLLVGSAPPSSSTPYVYSVYGKAAGYTRIVQLAISGVHVPFTLSGSGSVDSGGHTSSSGTATNKAIATVGSGGWYRFQALYTQTPGPSSDSYGLAVVDSGYTNQDATSYSFAGDGTSGVTIDAPQGEPGNFATSYIPTPSGSVTRSADVVTAASKASQWLAAGPSTWEIEDITTGTITTTNYDAGAFTFPQNVRYRSVIFYPAGTVLGNTGSSAGSNTATAVGAWIQAGVGSSAGDNTSSATSAPIQAKVGASAGANTATAVGAWIQAGVGSSAGANTVSGVGAWIQAGTGASTGDNTSSATAAPIQAKVGAAAGANTATAVGAWIQAGVGSSAGANTSSATTAPIQAKVGAAAGSNTATAVGAWIQAGVASSAGTNTASATGAWIQAGVGNAAGANTAAAFAAGAGSVAASAGTNTATAVGAWTQAGVASSVGANLTTAFGAWIQEGIASSVGGNSANAVGEAVHPGIQADFNNDFAADFAGYPGTIEASFNNDFNNDFSGQYTPVVVTPFIVEGVAFSAGSNIAAAFGSWEAIEQPPVYPPPPPVFIQWHPATEYHRVQAPRANRVYRHGTDLRRLSPQKMKRRYG